MLPTNQDMATLTFKPPPLNGTLTFLELFDYNAIHKAVTAFHIAGHYFINYVHGDAPVTVGILANTNSITYFMVLAGLLCLGFIPFPISTRNSVAAIVHLIKSTGAKHLIVSQDVSLQNTVDIICRQLWEADINGKLTTIPIPHFNDLFSGKPGSYELFPPDQLVFLVLFTPPTRMCCGMPGEHTVEKWTCVGKAWSTGNASVPSVLVISGLEGVMLNPCLDTLGFYFSVSISVGLCVPDSIPRILLKADENRTLLQVFSLELRTGP
ncbi:hypothetical protein F5146DRAFT_1168850 [Armillaria mellea]|nr:hypothetical protein F5146DRAFT_1168850 [Armillaria mellea]